jgi:hypothetical protein
VHCLAIKLLIGPLVLHVVQASESIHVAHLLVGARCTCVPISDIKPASETHILVCPLFCHVRKPRILLLRRLHAGQDIWYGCPVVEWYHLGTTNEWEWGARLGWTAWVALAVSIAGVTATTSATRRGLYQLSVHLNDLKAVGVVNVVGIVGVIGVYHKYSRIDYLCSKIPFRHSALLPFRHPAILPFRHLAILPFYILW